METIGAQIKRPPKHIIEGLKGLGSATIAVRSKDVNKVQLVSRMTGDLVRAGVVLGAPGGSQYRSTPGSAPPRWGAFGG